MALPMSVGYVEGSETYRNLRRLPRIVRRPETVSEEQEKALGSPAVIPATSVWQADTSLPGRPLRITIHGVYPSSSLNAKRRRALPMAVDLDALFPSPDPAFPNPLRYQAWSLRQRPAWSPSPPVSFRFPLDWESLPQFVLRVRTEQGPPLVLRTRFTLDNEPGRPRLRRGVYVFGFAPAAWTRDVKLTDFARAAPPELSSVLVSMDPEPEEE